MRKLNKLKADILQKSFVKDYDEYYKALSSEPEMIAKYLTFEKPDKETFSKAWVDNSCSNSIELFSKDLEYDKIMFFCFLFNSFIVFLLFSFLIF